jgi:hypothetical protein
MGGFGRVAFSILLLLLLAQAAFALDPVLNLTSTNVIAGSDVDVPITFITGTTSVTLLSIQLVLPDGISYADATVGQAANDAGWSVYCYGTAICNLFGDGLTPIENGTVAIIRFHVDRDVTGSQDINLSDVEGVVATDQDSNPVNVTLINGSLTIIGQSPLIISDVQVGQVTDTNAVVTWSTSEATTTYMKYNLQFDTLLLNITNETDTVTHEATLTGLLSAATYEYRIVAQDADGNNASSAIAVFTTTALPPPNITNISSSSITDQSATITWTTDVASDCQVEYGEDVLYGSASTLNATLVTQHTVTVDGLGATTLYHYRVRSTDDNGTLATSADRNFTTLASNLAPVVDAGANQTITLPANATLTPNLSDDGLPSGTLSYAWSKVSGPGTVTFANASRANTTASFSMNGTYVLRLNASDGALWAADNLTVIVNPNATPPAISGVNVTNITAAAAIIHWVTNEASDSQVQYGLNSSYGTNSTRNSTLATTHSVTISSLISNTTYHFRVRSADAFNNTNSSVDYNFTTLVDSLAPALTMSSPTNTTYTSRTVNLRFVASDTGQVDSCWYKLNGVNNSLPGCANTTLTAATGQNTLTLYANDTGGNMNSTNVTFTVTVQSGSSGGGGGGGGAVPTALLLNVTPTRHTLSSTGSFSFRLSNDALTHTLTIKDIAADAVRFVIRSTPVEVLLRGGETQDVDLNADGRAEVRLVLESFSQYSATFSISTAPPPTPAPPASPTPVSQNQTQNVTATPSTNESAPPSMPVQPAANDTVPPPATAASKKTNASWVWWAMAAALVLVIILFFAWKKRRTQSS